MRRLLLALVAASCAIAAAVVGATARTVEVSVAVGPTQFVNPARPIDANNSPALAVNPRLATNLVLTHRVDRPTFGALLHSSLDSGASWSTLPLPLPDGLDRPFAPDLAFAPDGTLFVSYVNLRGNGNVPENVWLTSSKDGGRTLSPPVRVAGPLAFQVRIAVDRAGRVHLTWMQAQSVGLLKLTGQPNPVLAVTSGDGGRTFAPPVTVSDRDRPRVGAATPVVDGRGNLVVLYQDYKDDRRDFEFLDGPPWEEPFALVLTRSSDGGATFTPGREIDTGLVPARRFLVFLPEFPSIAAGSGDNLVVAWSDARNGDEDVFLRHSADGGRSWAAPARVNDNPEGDGTAQSLPRVDVAPDGRVDVVYLDRRHDPDDILVDASFATSRDDGRSFTTTRLSSAPFDSRVGPDIDPLIGIDFGSRLALTSADHGAVTAWTDTSLGTEETGRQDIAAAAVTISTVAAASRTSVTIALALLASAVAALTAWAVAGGRRQKGEASAPG